MRSPAKTAGLLVIFICMVFRIVQAGNALPASYPVDPNAEFQPGMIAQFGVIGNQTVIGVSDGTAPFGIIDDIKTKAFTAPSIDEIVVVNIPDIIKGTSGSNFVNAIDVKAELQNPNVLPSSFVTNPVDVLLIPRNGNIVFQAGTILNYDNDGDGIPDSIRTVVNYTYQIPNVPGDDTTSASSRVTVWFMRLIGVTNQFETNRPYPLNANLFVSERGLLTTQQPTPDHPAVAFVTGSPSAINGELEFVWL